MRGDEVKELKVLHRQAMQQTDLAIAARQGGDEIEALRYFCKAYELEAKAAKALANEFNTEPTRSVLFRSAATLALDCKLLAEAERLIYTALSGNCPEEIAEELRDLLEQVGFERHLELRGITLHPDEIQMSIAGKGIGHGIAPAEAFLQRVETTETLLYRTAARKQNKAYHDRGRRDKSLRESLELYMTVPRAASFAVTFKIGKGNQLSIPGMSIGEQVIDEVLECLELFTRGDENRLKERIREDAYYRNFISLARNIAPDGEEVDLVGFTTIRRGETKKVALTTARKDISVEYLPSPDGLVKTPTAADGEVVKVSGVLKLADSRKRTDEIQLVDAGNVKHAIMVPAGMMSDIVKPLWDTLVIVTGTQKGKKIYLTDIRPG